MDERASGVLLPIFSLPGPFSIGCFGNEAVDFARQLRDMGFTYWQILPLTPPAGGDSPYQCYSAYAGNPLMVDLRQLVDHDLLTPSELADFQVTSAPHTCHYPEAAATHQFLLELAFSRCDPEEIERIDRYAASAPAGIKDYALFMSIRERYDNISWHLWPDAGLRSHDPEALAQFTREHHQTVRFHLFVQYWFFRQWQALRTRINALGVRIMGDLPIYLAYDSSDVWAERSQFELDENNQPVEVAGVPPDYFTANGQLWGNPLYHWQAMKQDGYDWWIRRIRESFRLFDVLRLDHFRGFVNYWAVSNGETTARKGRWRPGPAAALFKAVAAACPEAVLVAEDLGANDDGAVAAFLKHSGLPGMRVLQFGFDIHDDNAHLPHNHIQNSVAYSGTHDNNTLLGWLYDSVSDEREYGLAYAGVDASCNWGQGGPDAVAVRALLRTLWQSCAKLIIVPVQDLLGYGADTRINTPGESEGQWRWRATADDLKRIDQTAFRAMNRIYRRENHALPPSGT